jgi:NarL family two-component system sensor histidine kinase YdfH
MKKNISQKQSDLDKDPRIFMWVLNVVMAFMVGIVLFSQPEMRQPLRLIPFLILVLIHLILHWNLDRIAERPRLIIAYIVVQGAVAFALVWFTGALVMAMAVYMGLIGEAAGLLGLTRRGALAILFFLVLGAINFVQFSNPRELGGALLGIIPMIFFVVLYVTLYLRQMDARAKAQELLVELEAANQQLSEYAARVEDLTIVAERQRMARELHDTLSQGLAGLILQLEAVDAHLTQNHPERAGQIVKQTMERARFTLDEARRAITDLRSTTNITNLDTAIHAEMEHFEHATGLKSKLTGEIPTKLPDSIHETALRITAEALTNIARHAQAKEVSIHIEEINQQIQITVCDDGRGFDPNNISGGHYGLLGMRERARLVGGSIQIDSQPSQGTCIKVSLPVHKDAHESD